jgi:hypothetical protein
MFSVFNRLSLFIIRGFDVNSPCDSFFIKFYYSVFPTLFFMLTLPVFYYLDFIYFNFFYTYFFYLCFLSLFSFYSAHALYLYLVDFSFPIRLRVFNVIIFTFFSLFFVYSFFDSLIMFFYVSYEVGFFDHYQALLNGIN